jgi:ankyrin repeat protein
MADNSNASNPTTSNWPAAAPDWFAQNGVAAEASSGQQIGDLQAGSRPRPTMKALARKSILKTRQEKAERAARQRQHARIVLPSERPTAADPAHCIVDLSSMTSLVMSNIAETSATSTTAAGDEQEAAASTAGPQARLLDLAVESEPEELDLKLLWLTRRAEWAQVEELVTNRRQLALLRAIGAARLRATMTEGSLWTPLHYVARDNKAHLVERLVRLGYNVNARTYDQFSALHLAAMFMPIRGPECEATIRALLANHADPMLRGGPKDQLVLHILAGKASLSSLNALNLVLDACPDEARLEPDAEGMSPLLIAIRAGNEGAVQDLLNKLAREQLHFKQTLRGEYAIHMATKQKDIEILKIVIDAGCSLDLQNEKGQTALHLAAACEMEEFVRLLCQAGADPDVQDNDHQSPIHLATANGFNRITDILTERFKASIMNRTKDGSTLMHLASSAYNAQAALTFIRKGIPIHMPNKEGAKCIHIAAIHGHVEVVKAIVTKGESVDCRTKDGFTPLHLAVKFAKLELVECLLGLGANLQLNAIKGGETALHLATLVDKGEDCVNLLIKSGADVDAVDRSGETPLHYACRANNIKAVRLLLEDGARIDMQNERGENILHICVKESNLELIRDVIIQHVTTKRQVTQAKLLINQTNLRGESSVHYACTLTGNRSHRDDEDREIIRALLVNKGDVFLQNHELLQTPVHYCCRSGNTRILQEILAHLDQQLARVACNKPAKALWTPLFYACHEGHQGIIKMLINQTARIDVFDEQGEAPLHVAVSRGHTEVVDILLEHNAFVNVRNKPGMTPLHIAAQLGYNSMVTRLIKDHKAILDAMTLIKQIPLHLAAENGQLDVCKTLLSLGSDLNAIDNQSQTPLHLAARKNHAEVLKLFLTIKPELIKMANKNGYTCGHIAAMNGSLDAIKELLRFNRDAVINARIKRTNSTALHLASENGNAELVKLLLTSGAKQNDENALGETALHLAAKNGHVKVLHTIRSSEWKLCSRRNGLTALHVASNSGQTEFVAEMLRCRVPGGIRSERSSVEPKSDFGLTPLHLACRNGHEGVVRMLLNSAGVQVDSPSEINKTIPVHLAAQGGHLLVAGLLISRSTDGLTQADKHGRTALHFAASHGHRDMVGLLIGQGAEMNFQDDRGWTPLHYAAKHGYLEVVRLLVESGADPTMTCREGKVPICMAAASGHKDVLSYLWRKEHDSFELMQDKMFLIDLMACSKQHANRPIQEFILVNDEAPIDIAVKLAKCYETLIEKDKDRARDLVVARDLCDQVATDLLTIVASMNNSTSLLKSYDRSHVEFLDVLIELDRKDVVSQHSVQRYLSDVWIGSLKWNFGASKFVLLFFAFLLCPPIWVVVSCPAGHRLATIPVIKFISYLISHIFFILLLVVTIINPWLPIYRWTNLLPPAHEWLLFLWFCGNLATIKTNPPDKGGFGSIKLVNLVVGFAAIGVHVLGAIFLPHDAIPYVLFTRNQLLALVLLFSFVELINFLTFHHLFGPWAVIILELMKDMMRFVVIMGIFLVGFSLTVSAIYAPVFEPLESAEQTALKRQQQQQQDLAKKQPAAGKQQLAALTDEPERTLVSGLPSTGLEFQSPLFTFEMLFYSLFGLVEPDLMPPMHSNPSVSKVIMKLVFGVYMMITVVVLINLLIAMMSNTYQRIEARSDIEWKFGRAKLIRNMIRTSPTPSPLILLLGVWIDWYREWRRRQASRQKVELLTVAAFNRKASVSEAAARAAQHWMSKAPQLSARLQLERERNNRQGKRRGYLAAGGLEEQLGGAGARGAAVMVRPPSRAASISQMTGDTDGGGQQQPQAQQLPGSQISINEVVNWPTVVRKYWENVGVVVEREDEQPMNGEGGGGVGSTTPIDSDAPARR